MALPPPTSMTEALATKLLLVGWDAADWQMLHPLIDAGRMPHLKRLVENGTIGNLATLQPMLSPLLWTSIATGKRAYLHGVTGFVEPTPDGTALRPTASSTRQCKALWNILAQSGKHCQALGWYASHPAENINGVCVSQLFHVAPASATPDDWPPQPHAVFPAELADDLTELRFHPAEVTAQMLLQFVPAAAQLDQRDPEVQRLLNSLARRLAECISLHALTTALMEEQPWDFCTMYYDTIDRVGHDFMVFHPPRLDTVRHDLFEPFKQRKLADQQKKDSANQGPDLNRRKELLETYPLDQLKFVGTLEKAKTHYALIRAEQTVHRVKAGNFLGQNFGQIVVINETEVTLKESIQDSEGEWKESEAALQLIDDLEKK